ncbi:MAG: MFS transporter [Endomicrobium sp.]|jgi:MFS family permease|nr:MFS transporter [Endomicrobium sp.]
METNATEQPSPKKTPLWTKSFILAGIANFLLFFSFYLLMPTLPFYLTNFFHVTNSQAGLIISGYIACAILIRPFSGFIADSFDRKTIYIVSYFAFMAFFAGYIAATALIFFILIRASHGFAFGAATTTSNTVVIDILPFSRQGEGIGYFGLSSTLAMAIGPVIGLMIYDRFPFVILFYGALISGIIGSIFALTVKVPPNVRPKVKETISFDRFFLVRGFPLGINFLLLGIPYGMITTYIAMYGKYNGISGGVGTFFVVCAAGLVFSRLFSGKQIDKGRIIHVITAGTFMASLTLIGLFFVDKIHIFQSALYYFSALMIGLSYGMMFPAFNFMFINMAENNRRATANSTYLTSWDLGIASGVILGGKIMDISKISSIYAAASLVALAAGIYFVTVSSGYFKRKRLR